MTVTTETIWTIRLIYALWQRVVSILKTIENIMVTTSVTNASRNATGKVAVTWEDMELPPMLHMLRPFRNRLLRHDRNRLFYDWLKFTLRWHVVSRLVAVPLLRVEIVGLHRENDTRKNMRKMMLNVINGRDTNCSFNK